MQYTTDKIWVAIPAIDEQQWIQVCLESLSNQNCRGFSVVVCVNQTDSWWDDTVRREICENNRSTLEWLKLHKTEFPFRLYIVDCSSPGKGWPAGKGGAGYARDAAMSYSIENGGEEILIVSADADTRFDPGYLSDIAGAFNKNHQAGALAAPYYHDLTSDDTLNSAILRYEIFLRLVVMNLIRIKSPYAFTAIGSAMALRGEAYISAGGVPRKSSGEDFYLLQKIAKRRPVLCYLQSKVYPAARLSSRVGFGTGPALAKIISGADNLYNLIHPDAFLEIRDIYNLFPKLFTSDVKTPVDEFLVKIFGSSDIWRGLRENAKYPETFIKACHQKFDGLRIWQYVRQRGADFDQDEAFRANVELFLPGFSQPGNDFTLRNTSTENLAYLRSALFVKEMEMREAYDKEL